MTDCPRLGKLFGGCRFRPRHDEVSASPSTADHAFWAVAGGQKIATIEPTPARKTYLGDVCETCGAARFKREMEPK